MFDAWSQEDERTQMKAFVERIYIERASVVLVGRDAHVVDELGRRLVQVLRQEVNLEVAVLFDVTDDKLLERVNQRLASELLLLFSQKCWCCFLCLCCWR